MARASQVAVAMCLLATPSRARAQARPALPLVHLEARGCGDDLAWADVQRLVGLEMGTHREGPPADDANLTEVVVECAGTDLGLVLLRVRDPTTGKTLERRVDVHRVLPAARARLLALAIVELMAASWVELEFNPRPALPSPDQTASALTRVAVGRVVSERRQLGLGQFGAYAEVRVFFAPTHFAVGWALSFERSLTDWLAATVDVAVERSDVDVRNGRAEIDLASGSLALLGQAETRRLAVRAGLGARVGTARIQGVPDAGSGLAGDQVTGAWGGPLVELRVDFPKRSTTSLSLRAELGWALASVRGLENGQLAVGVDDLWSAISVGLSIRL